MIRFLSPPPNGFFTALPPGFRMNRKVASRSRFSNGHSFWRMLAIPSSFRNRVRYLVSKSTLYETRTTSKFWMSATVSCRRSASVRISPIFNVRNFSPVKNFLNSPRHCSSSRSGTTIAVVLYAGK